jgi:hypothetical protein
MTVLGLLGYIALEIYAALASYRAERRATYWHRRRLRNKRLRQGR